MFFISENKLEDEILYPRIPINFLTLNGYEDSETKRVCFTPTIDQCLTALSCNCSDKIYYVYEPLDKDLFEKYLKTPQNSNIVRRPTLEEVPDCDITEEIWVLQPVRLVLKGKIKCIKDKDLEGMSYCYGENQIAELYKWEYIWI